MNAPTALRTYLDFEKPILELENKVAELKALHVEGKGPQIADEIAKLEQKAKAALVDTYARLTPWQKTLVARHPERPHALDFVNGLIEEFTPLAGDRYFAEDEAIVKALCTQIGVVVRRHMTALLLERSDLEPGADEAVAAAGVPTPTPAVAVAAATATALSVAFADPMPSTPSADKQSAFELGSPPAPLRASDSTMSVGSVASSQLPSTPPPTPASGLHSPQMQPRTSGSRPDLHSLLSDFGTQRVWRGPRLHVHDEESDEDEHEHEQDESAGAHAEVAGLERKGSQSQDSLASAVSVGTVSTVNTRRWPRESKKLRDQAGRITPGSTSGSGSGSGRKKRTVWPTLSKSLEATRAAQLAQMRTFEFDCLQHGSDELLELTLLMFRDTGVLDAFKIQPTSLQPFLLAVRGKYLDNPYHNVRCPLY